MATAVPANLVKQLRDKTGAGMMDCKRALEANDNDLEKSVDWLRQKGISKAEKKADRATNEGVVESYTHGNPAKLGVLVELNCESDFVAKTDDFRQLARELALQVAGMSPQYVRREDVPAAVVEREKGVYQAQVEGKPANIVDKILEGKLNAFYSQICLLEQPWIKDDKKRVEDLVKESIAKLGENISVARFVRLQVGETRSSEDVAADTDN
jgi:elongation factor Ts